jgi:hypothetical protein
MPDAVLEAIRCRLQRWNFEAIEQGFENRTGI